MNKNDFNQKMFGISCDLGVDDDSCTVGYTVDMGGNINIDWIKYDKPKEVKKLRPYFETKVVKVKKEKHEQHYCPCCGGKIEMEKPKGNWVNGENLDKIKIPVPCSYVMDNEKKYGMLNRVFFRGEYFYVITDCSQQYVDSNGEPFYHPSNLKTMFENLNIHILKGKIILYEEVE